MSKPTPPEASTTPTLSKHARKRNTRLKTSLAVCSLAISLVIAEALYRSHLRGKGFAGTATPDQYEFYKYDPVLGWANAPGQAGIYERAEFSYPVGINSRGMRQHEVAQEKASGTTRIAVIGDSFCWGIGVKDEDRFSELVEQSLKDTEVLNFGVSGWGPVQYHLLTPRIMALQPDFVLISFCLGNDFADNLLFMGHGRYKPYAELEDGKLKVRGHPIPNTRRFGYAAPEPRFGSVLLGGLFEALGDDSPPQTGLMAFKQEFLYQADSELKPNEVAAKNTAIAINKAIFKEIAKSYKEAGIEVLVVSAPSKREYNPAGKNGHVGYYRDAENLLKKTCEEVGVNFLPLVGELHGDDFWLKDGHWNREGHKKMAKAISAHLSATGHFEARE